MLGEVSKTQGVVEKVLVLYIRHVSGRSMVVDVGCFPICFTHTHHIQNSKEII